ncbi:MAG: sugar dehydrogenase [Thermoleophilia bacterium]|nr:sugar dehydrogenase [Thermoleophilia bacterium]
MLSSRAARLGASISFLILLVALAALMPGQASATDWDEQFLGQGGVAASATQVDGTLWAASVATVLGDGPDEQHASVRRRDAVTGVWTTHSLGRAEAGSVDIAVNDSGDVVVIWTSNVTGGDGMAGLWVARRDGAAGTWSTPFELATSAVHGAGTEHLGMDVDVNDAGGAIVAWASGASVDATDIMVRRSAGATWLVAEKLSRKLGDSTDPEVTCEDGFVQPAPGVGSHYDGNITSYYPAVALDEDGTSTLAYTLTCEFYGGIISVEHSVIDVLRRPAGGSWTAPANVSKRGTGGFPQLAAQGTTTYLAWGWWDRDPDPDESGMTIATATGLGTFIKQSLAVQAGTDQPRDVQIAARGASVSAVWRRGSPSPSYQVATIDGGVVGATHTLTDAVPSSYQSLPPVISYASDGSLAVAYAMQQPGGTPEYKIPVHVRTGGTWTTTELQVLGPPLYDVVGLAIAGGRPVVLGARAANSRTFLYAFAALAPNVLPTASFTAPASAVTGQSVTLDASLSTDSDSGDTLTYEWDFDGDGVWDTNSAETTSTTYTTPGTYDIHLRVADPRNGQATATHAITITAAATTGGGHTDNGDAEAARLAAEKAAALAALAAEKEKARLAEEAARLAAELAKQQELARLGAIKTSFHTQLAGALGTTPTMTKIMPVPSFDFGGFASAFQPTGNKALLATTSNVATVMAVGGCELACVMNASYVADLGPAPKRKSGRAAAKRVLLNLKGQKLALAPGKVGVLKVTMTKAQAAKISKVKAPKLLVTVVLTKADGTKVTEKISYRLKIVIKKPVKK